MELRYEAPFFLILIESLIGKNIDNYKCDYLL